MESKYIVFAVKVFVNNLNKHTVYSKRCHIECENVDRLRRLVKNFIKRHGKKYEVELGYTDKNSLYSEAIKNVIKNNQYSSEIDRYLPKQLQPVKTYSFNYENLTIEQKYSKIKELSHDM